MEPDVFIFKKLVAFDSDNRTGVFFKEDSISKIRLFFQFNRIICHEPKEIKTKMKKITKTENKNLCFKDQINFPKYI